MKTSDYLERWLAAYVVPFRAPSTAACYRRAIAALPAALLACNLDELDGLSIQEAINAKAAMHPRAAQLVFATLHAALHRAVLLHLIPSSPIDACIRPPHTAAQAAVFSAPQAAAYLAAARSVRSWPLLLLMLTCGLRRGEALGLQWSDIDFTSRILHIRRQRMRVSGTYAARPLKSRASLRDLPAPVPLLRELSAVRAGPICSMVGWVCDVTPETLARDHARALRLAGLPHVTLHGLRHTMATVAVGSGCPVRVLQGMLGHARYSLTADLYAAHLDASAYAPHADSIYSRMLG